MPNKLRPKSHAPLLPHAASHTRAQAILLQLPEEDKAPLAWIEPQVIA